ncbi:serine carboxypeptidase S28-domain-containing protein [Pholiota molesta]|nr:serine carboxypeptidase S28-domain-containing protein [Pholiota molesta]
MAHFRCLYGLSLLVSYLALVSARLSDGRPHANMMRPASVPLVSAPSADIPVTSRNGTVLPPYTTIYLFDQLIDHNNPSLGTFQQRFWHTWEFYEAGGPIILSTPGETNADGFSGYLTNRTINGQIAQQQNGSTIVLEHRFYGLSNPLPDLSVKSLKLHTIQQAIDDLEYFANNVNLPMPGGDSVGPDKAPWILVGGSYAGALTSWTMVNKPNLFAAGYASSAVVEAILDFWQYFEPIRQNMPKNCSADIQAVIAHVDQTLSGRNATAIQAIKDNWGLGVMTHLDDVAGALRNNLWDWQSLQITSGPGNQFSNFCDALEVKDGVSAPASGWGLDHAFSAWGSYWRTFYLANLCGGQDAETCLGTYNTTQAFWTDTSIDDANRSWMWIVCNEVGFLQEGAPPTSPTLVTRLVQPSYDLRQCQQMFSAAFPKPPNPNVLATNIKYRGWNVQINNLFFANGVRDPWRDATLSADGLNVKSTPSQPIGEGDGFHCSDLLTSSNIDPTVLAVQNEGLASMKTWIAAWKPQSGGFPVKTPRSVPTSPQQAPPSAFVKPINAWFKKFGGH